MITMGTTCMLGLMSTNPPMDETTVIEGVMIPSAKSVLPPMMARIYTHFLLFRSRAKSEKIPPSPLLSALSVITTYLRVVWIVSVQITQESTPRIKSVSMGKSSRTMAFITYNGDVPMSPNTMPNVTNRPATPNFTPWPLLSAGVLKL